jgi:hypothetical protein
VLSVEFFKVSKCHLGYFHNVKDPLKHHNEQVSLQIDGLDLRIVINLSNETPNIPKITAIYRGGYAEFVGCGIDHVRGLARLLTQLNQILISEIHNLDMQIQIHKDVPVIGTPDHIRYHRFQHTLIKQDTLAIVDSQTATFRRHRTHIRNR